MKQTTVEVRQLAIDHHKNSKSLGEIAKIINRSRSTVQYIISRYKKENRVGNKVKISPKKKLTEYDERWILRKVRENPGISAPKISAELKIYLNKEVSESTIRRLLRKNDYHGRVARNKPLINERNRKRRLEFAKQYMHQPAEFWNDVIFTDESKFNIFSSDGKVNIWRKPNTEMDVKNLRPTVKHGGGSVMVWGCMSAKGVGNLVFIDGRMDQWKYLSILKENLKPSAEKMGLSTTYKLYADNDPKHTANNSRMWVLYNCPKVLKTPAQSPDFNIIEHLWNYLDRKIRERPISNISQLKKALQEEWIKISPEYCKKLAASMPKRLQAAETNRGFPTKY